MRKIGHKSIFLLVFPTMLGCAGNEMPVPPDDTSHSDHTYSESPPVIHVAHRPVTADDLMAPGAGTVKPPEEASVLRATGKVLAPTSQTAIVTHAFPARAAEIHVQIGDRVKEGQALVTLESDEVGAAKSESYKAIVDCELARAHFEREKRLLKSGIGVKKNFLTAEGAYKIAQANREAAENRLHVLGFNEEQVQEIITSHQINPTITLYAPIAGKVISHEAVLGSPVDPSSEILTIIDPTLLWVDAQICEKDIAKAKIGQESEVTVPAYPDEVFRGKIIYVGDVVAEETCTFTVRAEVPNNDLRLNPGMSANLKILLDSDTRVVRAASIPPGGTVER